MSIAIGLAAALFAIFLQQLAVGVAGFAIGAAGLFAASRLLVPDLAGGLEAGLGGAPWWIWVVTIMGGVIGALVGLALFEVALILATSLAGAMLVVESGWIDLGSNAALLLLLATGGVAVQLVLRRREARD